MGLRNNIKKGCQSTIYYYNLRCFPENSFQIPGKTNTSMQYIYKSKEFLKKKTRSLTEEINSVTPNYIHGSGGTFYSSYTRKYHTDGKVFLCCKKTAFLVRSWMLGTKNLILKNPNYKNSIDDTVRICRFLHVSFTQDGTVLYDAMSDEKLRKQRKKSH